MKKRILIILPVIIAFLFLFFNHFIKYYFQPVAVVVPHHDLVKEKRLEFFKLIAKNRPKVKKIIIISPDHFSSNQYKVSYADRCWDLSNGQMEFDREFGSKIVDGLAKENGMIAGDHGIVNLLPDIKTVWPKAKVVPLLIGQSVRLEQLNDLINKINQGCRANCLLVASVDFSHYLPRALADIHDFKSAKALESLEIKSEKDLEVDSNQSLYVLTNFAKLRKVKDWHLYFQSNSGRIIDSRDAESTSHIFGWYQRGFSNPAGLPTFFTFLLARNLDPKKDKNSLGERFFYGVDYFNSQVKETFRPSDKIVIEPGGFKSEIKTEKDVLKISLGQDLALGGYVSEDGKIHGLLFLLLEEKKSLHFLLRGEERTKYLKKLLSEVDKKNFIVDTGEGTMTW